MFFESYPIPRRRVEGRGGGREEGRVHAEYEGFFMVSAMKRVLGRPVVCLSPFAICLSCLFFWPPKDDVVIRSSRLSCLVVRTARPGLLQQLILLLLLLVLLLLLLRLHDVLP